jgi:hypothetical protein
MDYTTPMADRLGIVPTDTVELKKQMQAGNDSVATATSRDMQLAIDKARFELRRKGIEALNGDHRDIKANPDGTYTATVDYRKPIASMPVTRSPEDSLQAARAGINPDTNPLLSALLRKP